MTGADAIVRIDGIIGETVISRATGNKLGEISDAIIDPIEGILLGFAVNTVDEHVLIVNYDEIFSVGPDAVMVHTDDSLTDVDESPLASFPLAKRDLNGVNVITDAGKLLGPVAGIYVSLAGPPQVIYELRDSIFDKLLGRSMFIPAAAGEALSDDAARLIVPHEVAENPADSLETLAQRSYGTGQEVVVRTLREGLRTSDQFDEPAQLPARGDEPLVGRGAAAGADDVTLGDATVNHR